MKRNISRVKRIPISKFNANRCPNCGGKLRRMSPSFGKPGEKGHILVAKVMLRGKEIGMCVPRVYECKNEHTWLVGHWEICERI